MAALSSAKRIVIKIGSALLVEPQSGVLRRDWLVSLASDVSRFKKMGVDVVLVSSGSIALGRRVLDLPANDLALEQSQAAAAVGHPPARRPSWARARSPAGPGVRAGQDKVHVL